MRTFVALPIPESVVVGLKRIQDQLRPLVADVRWVPVANVHLTLKFLGDIEPGLVPAIAGQLNEIAGSMAPFTLAAGGVGVFPNPRQARVLWVGLTGDLKRLAALQRKLESGLATLGFDRDHRPFRAHLTIGRMRRRPDTNTLGSLLGSMPAESSEPFEADQIRLYQSLLRPAGAEYILLHRANLAASGARTR